MPDPPAVNSITADFDVASNSTGYGKYHDHTHPPYTGDMA